MASRYCPVCGATVKLENLERHVANVHPREKPSVVLSEEERRAVRRDARRAGPAFHVRRSTLAVIAVVLISVVGVALAIPYLPAPQHPGAMAPLHTHDTSGKIHEESRELRDYTLGDFFRIWGQTFDAQQVLGHPAQTGHRVWMVVDGSTMSPSYSVVLRDQTRIQIVCGAG